MRKPHEQKFEGETAYSNSTSISGIFIRTHEHRSPGEPIVHANPGNPKPAHQKILETYDFAKHKELIEAKASTQPWIENADLYSYGRSIVDIAERIHSLKPDCCLGPLRGAAFPCSLVDTTVQGRARVDYFNFRENSNPANRPAITRELGRILARRNNMEEEFRVAVIDTAIGGQSINMLVQILKEFWKGRADFQMQK